MKNLKFSFVILTLMKLLIGLELFSFHVNAKGGDTPPSRNCRVSLSHYGHVRATINLVVSMNSGKTWVKQKIGPGDTLCLGVDKVEVKLSTKREDKTIIEYYYSLESGRRYTIYWNRNDAAWGIARITER